ncbi:phytanoyl-CoA dioxygenase family protein [Jannaschia sp. Os4]|uniref:phytanoyl-CoA dioxygenase family protein n=1 Tax=Jannaschia sp. Os4 TaxID=2807617 RepID=UPI00193A8099|nr:phytanoyl-CoA dioxygenase family protein [Jannaschia sp. Os4]MBM2578014.1 phytanoyl-CoA dioxygenase family protein [Jannaschia sp. Os4]
MLDDRSDLRFAPVAPREGGRLSRDAVETYNREGWIAPFDVLAPAEVAALRASVDGWLAAMGAEGAYGINCYQARLATLWDLCRHPAILDLVEGIVGPDVLCWATAILSKPPGEARAVPWHQDAGFWHLSPARTVTVWLAIDDADDANAAMRFIPRTHDRGALPMEAVEGAVFAHGLRDAEALGAPVTNVLRAGQCSLHADMLVHGSGPNGSDRRRCGLTLRYCPPEVRITDEGWRRGVEAVACRGSSGDWITHPRPGTDDIAAVTSPRAVGNN